MRVPRCGPWRAAAAAAALLALLPSAAAKAAKSEHAIFGGPPVKKAFKNWLKVWRSWYKDNVGLVPELRDETLPLALRKVRPKVVLSAGGAAGGVVTEGMGYAIMVEGVQAVAGDETALANGLALTRSWLGMVNGPSSGQHPIGGGDGNASSATDVLSWPYGVSAINVCEVCHLGPSGVAAWKYPTHLCKGGCHGSATDGDGDALMGMIYLAAALNYPSDLVDMIMRAVIAFASADLGFPDLYRVLPDGSKMFVPKGGSDWGGVLPSVGKYKTSHVPWCYSPGYFAPGHYRLFRAFAVNNWKLAFSRYLPRNLDGMGTTLQDLTTAFDGAVTAGYNILYRSSCSSGSVSNWVGVKAECDDPKALHCRGVPWATTPYVGKSGNCTASGTTFGAYGAEASRTPWRIAMDYILYPDWATKVVIYDRQGFREPDTVFNAKVYLNRIANQYKDNTKRISSPVALCPSYDTSHGAPNIICDGVPNAADVTWWGALLAYPTFTAFVAPVESLKDWESMSWMKTLVGLCDFGSMAGPFCDKTYFGAGQEVISTMIMAGALKPWGPPPKKKAAAVQHADEAIAKFDGGERVAEAGSQRWPLAAALVGGGVLAAAVGVMAVVSAAVMTWRIRARATGSRRVPAAYEEMHAALNAALAAPPSEEAA